MNGLKPRFKSVGGSALMALVGACALPFAYSAQKPEMRVISSRADAIGGDDVLVEVSVLDHSSWIAQLDGRDVTRSFRPTEGSGTLLALLNGLKPGKHTLQIRIGGTIRSKLELVAHPLAGPIFSGPHDKPFICQTVVNGLGPALDADCTAKAVVQYYYKSTEPAQRSGLEAIKAAFPVVPGELTPGFKAYDLAGSPPSDVAKVVTSEPPMAETENYIVRREIGTINRDVYEIQFLHQPGQPLPTPWTHATPGWNGRLIYVFAGGDCFGSHVQGVLGTVGMEQEPLRVWLL